MFVSKAAPNTPPTCCPVLPVGADARHGSGNCKGEPFTVAACRWTARVLHPFCESLPLHALSTGNSFRA